MTWMRLQKFSKQITVTVSFHWARLHLNVLGKATHARTHARTYVRTHAHRLTAAAPPFLCNADFVSCSATNNNSNDNNEDYHLHYSL